MSRCSVGIVTGAPHPVADAVKTALRIACGVSAKTFLVPSTAAIRSSRASRRLRLLRGNYAARSKRRDPRPRNRTKYNYDAVSRLYTLAHNLDGAGTTYDETLTFTYNPASQIITRNLSNGTYSFAVTPNVARTYSVNGLNQYTQIVSSPTTSPTYDPNGNLTSDGSTTFGYDAENRLTSATGGHTATLVYDPLGRLYQTSGGAAGTTRFLYDGDRIVAEYNSTGALLRRYVHGTGVDEPIVWYEGSSVSAATRRFLHADHQGSIVAVTSSTGATTEADTYDTYGVSGSANKVRFQYTGQVNVPELGLYYYKARIYNPTLGRFMQTDPVGYSDDVDLYTYVGNDPLDRTDPTGNEGSGCWNNGEGCAPQKSPGDNRARVDRPNQPWREKIFGRAQKTGTVGHAVRSAREAVAAAKDPNTERVSMNQSLRTTTGDKDVSNVRPDVTIVSKPDESGTKDVSIKETPSNSQTPSAVQGYYQRALESLRGLLRPGTVEITPVTTPTEVPAIKAEIPAVLIEP